LPAYYPKQKQIDKDCGKK